MAHPDLDQLLNALLPFAQQQLSKRGEFYPFGASLNSNGEIVAAGVDDGREYPDSQSIIDLLQEGFRQDAVTGSLRAAGICYSVSIVPRGETEKSDAIGVILEHQSGESIDVYLPYKRIHKSDIRYGQILAQRRPAQIFTSIP